MRIDQNTLNLYSPLYAYKLDTDIGATDLCFLKQA
jgi:hypothetical protein